MRRYDIVISNQRIFIAPKNYIFSSLKTGVIRFFESQLLNYKQLSYNNFGFKIENRLSIIVRISVDYNNGLELVIRVSL